jgi:hypothetical protein
MKRKTEHKIRLDSINQNILNENNLNEIETTAKLSDVRTFNIILKVSSDEQILPTKISL